VKNQGIDASPLKMLLGQQGRTIDLAFAKSRRRGMPAGCDALREAVVGWAAEPALGVTVRPFSAESHLLRRSRAAWEEHVMVTTS
jgi:hypothetical protein